MHEPPRGEREVLAQEVLGRSGKCKYCRSNAVTKYGFKRGIQVLRCGECFHTFLDNGRLPKMRTPTHVIGASLHLRFDGLSLTKTQGTLENLLGVRRHISSIWRWAIKFCPLVSEYLSQFKARLSDRWQADETVIFIRGKLAYFWEVLDSETRYIPSVHLSTGGRTSQDAVTLFRKARNHSLQKPKLILTDRLQAYGVGVHKVFYSYREHWTNQWKHENRIHITDRDRNINLIERFHNTLKERYKTLRGFKSWAGAKAFLGGFVTHYNHLRIHSVLKSTPAEIAGVVLPERSWRALLKWAVAWSNVSQAPSHNVARGGV